MAFSANFSVSQGVNPADFTITDTSTGSDPNLTTRSISLYMADGSLLGGSAISWPLSDGSSKTISGLLTRDFCLDIQGTWTSSSPIPGSDYSHSEIVAFTGNSNLFAWNLLQQIAANQAITRDSDFENNLAILNSEILNAERAAGYEDIGNSQQALDRIYNMIVKQNFYF